MTAFRATLFDTLRIYLPDGRLLDIGSPTTRSLLGYLLLNRQPIDRRRLAFIFWPDAIEAAARRNLRQYLHHIRAALAPLDPQDTLLLTDGSTVQINPQAEISLDVEQFLHQTRPEASPQELEQALSLYTGDLLADLYDDWCTPERERLRQIWLQTLERYSGLLLASGNLHKALSVVQQWANAEPFDETARRRLMTLYAMSGERAKAIQVYQSFAQTLADELQTTPLPETQALLRAIQDGAALPAVEEKPALLSQSKVGAAPARLPPSLPFIGRQAELSALEAAYQEAKAGAARLLLISGEAGIGKTRLLQEYLASHGEISVLQSVCYELDSMVPFAPVRQAFENSPALVASIRTRLPPPRAAVLRAILPEAAQPSPALHADQQTDGLALRTALTDLLLLMSQTVPNPPLHLILDDLHWADASTWELLASLTRYPGPPPFLVIGLVRMEDVPAERWPLIRAVQRSASTRTLSLPRLTPDETAALARHLTPQQADNPIFLQRLYHETEGNPFFIIETVHAIQESGSLQLPIPAASIPHSIQRVIEARLDRLQPGSREALACAAAIGRSFTLPLLQEILEDSSETIITFIEEWLQRGLVYEDKQGYDFRHDKFRQVVYAGLSRARREFIHGRIAGVLETAIPPADVTTLAYHYARSNQPLKALPYLTRAGEQALRLRSYQEARQFGLQAVNLLGQLPGPRQRSERIDINLQLAQAYAFTGNMQRAVEILNETEHMALTLKDERRLGQIFRRAAQFFWLRGQPKTADDYARRCLRVAEELGDNELLYAALRMLGRVSIALSAFDDAIAYLLRYVNLCEEIETAGLPYPPPADLPIVLGYLGVAYARVGAWERAVAVSQRGVAMAEADAGGGLDATAVFARMQLAMVKADLHCWDECLEILAALPKPREPQEMTPPLYMATSLYGLAQAQRGDTAAALSSIRLATAWAKQSGYRVFHYLPHMFLAEALMMDGQTETALEEIQFAWREAQSAGNRWAVGVALRLRAEIAARRKQPVWEQIESDLLESMQLLRQIRARPDLARTYLSLRRLYDRAGQIAWAVDCHFRATTIFDELGMEEELRAAQGQAARERQGAVVIPNLPLRGPNVRLGESMGIEENSE
ncbi:MAG: AAA family ATPase [Candidatus Villigracilaceae bacterium]